MGFTAFCAPGSGQTTAFPALSSGTKLVAAAKWGLVVQYNRYRSYRAILECEHQNSTRRKFYKYQVTEPDGTMDKCILFRTVIIVPQGMSIPGKNNCL
jgi:hypothetical protein